MKTSIGYMTENKLYNDLQMNNVGVHYSTYKNKHYSYPININSFGQLYDKPPDDVVKRIVHKINEEKELYFQEGYTSCLLQLRVLGINEMKRFFEDLETIEEDGLGIKQHLKMQIINLLDELQSKGIYENKDNYHE